MTARAASARGRGRTARNRSSARARRRPRTRRARPRTGASGSTPARAPRGSRSSPGSSRGLGERDGGLVEVPGLHERRPPLEEVVDVIHLELRVVFGPAGLSPPGGSAHHARRARDRAAATGQLAPQAAALLGGRRARVRRRSAGRARRAHSRRAAGSGRTVARAIAASPGAWEPAHAAQRALELGEHAAAAAAAPAADAAVSQAPASASSARGARDQRHQRCPSSASGAPASGSDGRSPPRPAAPPGAAGRSPASVGWLRARRRGRRRVERDPADARVADLDPRVGVEVADHVLARLGVQRAGGEAGHDARGDAGHPQQQRHRAGVLLAVAGLGVEQEAVERRRRTRRRLGVAEAVAAGRSSTRWT